MTLDTKLPKTGDRVVVVTTSLFRYEGLFEKVNRARNSITLTNVRAFGTENRPAREHVAGTNKIYVEVVFKASEIEEFAVVDQKPRGLQADPAVVRVDYRGGNQQRNWSNRNNTTNNNNISGYYHKNFNPNSRYNNQRADVYQRGYRQQNVPLWARQNFQRGRIAPLGPNSPRFQQNRASPSQRTQPWMRQTRRPSEGVFPQRNPGVKSVSFDDYDFEKAIEEFKQINMEKSRPGNDDCGNAKDLPTKGDSQEKIVPIYEKDNFFDNLKLASEEFDSSKKAQSENAAQTGSTTRTPPRYSRNQLKEHLIETFGEDTVASLYYMNNDQRDRSRPDYKPTVNFQKHFRGFNPASNQNARHIGTSSFGRYQVLTGPLIQPQGPTMASRLSANLSRKVTTYY
ncbi:hypothetical protein BIW11_13464 [Tropilaelaps mercedesae]|uniref:Lsm14-like N-terminal domain-containing protein n=1 Tax=Tropilaelaps mercedesae TaxID=418985 RepID=A0A1V9X1T5_9ACAR|nr:hypothetical protein BIW11_13464 [Tropilaelaps mercedesae]